MQQYGLHYYGKDNFDVDDNDINYDDDKRELQRSMCSNSYGCLEENILFIIRLEQNTQRKCVEGIHCYCLVKQVVQKNPYALKM